MSLPKELDHLRIPFDDIKSGTNNFADKNFLGQGGFGPVYKGQLPSSTGSHELGRSDVAVKRLNVRGGQGQHEFLMEIVMLASYKHENLVSLVGFSDEGNEKVLVYKHEVNGSLDNHLASTNLTWEQRLGICLGAARGLDFLHGGVGSGHRVLHRDIKSSNILLDANMKAKISDFGLSKIGVLTKESYVYSFGVVLFEVLCGRLAMIMEYEDERRFLSRLVKIHQEKGTVNKIIIPHLLQQMKQQSLEEFSRIAFQCLNEDRKQRPTMDLVVQGLETALKHQLVKPTTTLKPQTGTRTELWGVKSAGGSPFVFKLKSYQKLRKITIDHGLYIHSLMFTAEDSDGYLHSSEKYSGLVYDPNNSGETFVIDFEVGEEIIGISGTFGMDRHAYMNIISSLSFETNKKKHGPFGKVGTRDTHFSGSWKFSMFDGFYGHYAWHVDAIGCFLKEEVVEGGDEDIIF